jgi:DMSO reductase family type II enzyme heme b subunit
MIEARYVASLDRAVLVDPDAKPWRAFKARRMALKGTPLDLQPTAAIRASWAGKKIGATSRVDVKVLHDARVLAFHLEWRDSRENREFDGNTTFVDAVAILLPSTADAPFASMGAPGKAVNAWYWRADDKQGRGRHLVAEGFGTTRTIDSELVQGHGFWKDGRWCAVIARPLRVQTNEPVAQLAPGATTRFGVAVWEGNHGERAGIKSFSGEWQELRLEPTPAAGR